MTTLADVAFWTGAGLEALGLLVGAAGFRSTWREFSAGGRLFGREIEWIKSKYQVVRDFVHRMLGLKQDAVPPQVIGTIKVTESVDMMWGVGYVGLPSPADDLEAFAAAVEERMRSLNDNLRAVREQLDGEVQARKAADNHVLSDLGAKVANVEGLSRQIAVGGLRAQVIGWSCIALGFALQSTATLFM